MQLRWRSSLPWVGLFAGALPQTDLILHLWILSGIACFTLVANKDVRYTAPVLRRGHSFQFAGCGSRRHGRPTFKLQPEGAPLPKAALVAAIAAWALVSFFNAQWPRAGRGTAIDTPRYRWMLFARNYYGDHRPLDDDWSVPRWFDAVSNRTDTAAASARSRREPALPEPVERCALCAIADESASRAPLIDVRWLVEPSTIDRIDDCDFYWCAAGSTKRIGSQPSNATSSS